MKSAKAVLIPRSSRYRSINNCRSSSSCCQGGPLYLLRDSYSDCAVSVVAGVGSKDTLSMTKIDSVAVAWTVNAPESGPYAQNIAYKG